MSDGRGFVRPDFFQATGQLREDYLKLIERAAPRISYSERYRDDAFEYRHVRLPRQEYEILVPKDRLLSEYECQQLGIQQSPGWQHYMVHKPEPWVMPFRRPLPKPSA